MKQTNTDETYLLHLIKITNIDSTHKPQDDLGFSNTEYTCKQIKDNNGSKSEVFFLKLPPTVNLKNNGISENNSTNSKSSKRSTSQKKIFKLQEKFLQKYEQYKASVEELKSGNSEAKEDLEKGPKQKAQPGEKAQMGLKIGPEESFITLYSYKDRWLDGLSTIINNETRDKTKCSRKATTVAAKYDEDNNLVIAYNPPQKTLDPNKNNDLQNAKTSINQNVKDTINKLNHLAQLLASKDFTEEKFNKYVVNNFYKFKEIKSNALSNNNKYKQLVKVVGYIAKNLNQQLVLKDANIICSEKVHPETYLSLKTSYNEEKKYMGSSKYLCEQCYQVVSDQEYTSGGKSGIMYSSFDIPSEYENGKNITDLFKCVHDLSPPKAKGKWLIRPFSTITKKEDIQHIHENALKLIYKDLHVKCYNKAARVLFKDGNNLMVNESTETPKKIGGGTQEFEFSSEKLDFTNFKGAGKVPSNNTGSSSNNKSFLKPPQKGIGNTQTNTTTKSTAASTGLDPKSAGKDTNYENFVKNLDLGDHFGGNIVIGDSPNKEVLVGDHNN